MNGTAVTKKQTDDFVNQNEYKVVITNNKN